MKKLFMVAGELSGDKLGAWFLEKHLQRDYVFIEAVGGTFMEAAGAQLWERFEKLNVTGIFEIVRHIPSLLLFMNKLARHIIDHNFDEVLLIDFPGFNLRLAKKLKKLNSAIKITYLSPPQMWVWGAWRVRSIQKFIDRVIVLYPFEVAWYRQRGVQAEWLGNPVYDRLLPYFKDEGHRAPIIAIIPGSRSHEVKTLFPCIAQVMLLFLKKYPQVTIVIPHAESMGIQTLQEALQACNIHEFTDRIKIVSGEQGKIEALRSCCLALTKPGTVTLELALLGIPTLMFFKTSWINYVLGKMVIQVDHMALPNLLLEKPVYKEFVQYECDSQLIFNEAVTLFEAFLKHDSDYFSIQKKLLHVRKIFAKKE